MKTAGEMICRMKELSYTNILGLLRGKVSATKTTKFTKKTSSDATCFLVSWWEKLMGERRGSCRPAATAFEMQSLIRALWDQAKETI